MKCHSCKNHTSFWGDNYYTYCGRCGAIIDNNTDYEVSDNVT